MKDVKALKRRVEISFPDLTADDLDALFPPKVNKLYAEVITHCLMHPEQSLGLDTLIM